MSPHHSRASGSWLRRWLGNWLNLLPFLASGISAFEFNPYFWVLSLWLHVAQAGLSSLITPELGILLQGLPWWLKGWRIRLQCGRPGFIPWVGKIPWRKAWLPTPGFLPRESHGQESLADYSPHGCKGLDMTERFSLSGVPLKGLQSPVVWSWALWSIPQCSYFLAFMRTKKKRVWTWKAVLLDTIPRTEEMSVALRT